MPVVVTADRKLPLGVHGGQVHKVQANIPYHTGVRSRGAGGAVAPQVFGKATPPVIALTVTLL